MPRGQLKKRRLATEEDRSGPNKAHFRAGRLLLRDMDWAAMSGSKRWLTTSGRKEIYRQLAAFAIKWRFENRSGPPYLVPHDEKTLRTLVSNMCSENGIRSEELYGKGSEVVPQDFIESMQYDRETEIAAIRLFYRDSDPVDMHLWCTFSVSRDELAEVLYVQERGAEAHHQNESEEQMPGAWSDRRTARKDTSYAESEDEHVDVDDDMEYSAKDRRPGTGQKTTTSSNRRRHCQDLALVVVASYIDEHCKGESNIGSAKGVARELAELYDIEFYNTDSKQFEKRQADQYCNIIKQQILRYNNIHKPDPPKLMEDLLFEGEPLMPGLPDAMKRLGLQSITHGSVVKFLTSDSEAAQVEETPQGPTGRPDRSTQTGRYGTKEEDEISWPDPPGGTIPAPRCASPSQQLQETRGYDQKPGLKRARSHSMPAAPKLRDVVGIARPSFSPLSAERTGDRRLEHHIPTESTAKHPAKRSKLQAKPNSHVHTPHQVIGSSSASSSGSSVRTPTPAPAYSGLNIPIGNAFGFSLEDRELGRRMTHISSIIKAAVHDLLEDDGLVALSRRPAILNPRPSMALRATYQTLFDIPASRHVKEQISTKATAAQLAIAVVGATFSREIFTGDCTSELAFEEYAAERKAVFGNEMALLDAELRSQRTDYDTLLRRVYLRHTETIAFGAGIVAQIAASTAKYALDALLEEHLQENSHVCEETQHRWLAALREVAKEAMLLRCELSCSRDPFLFRCGRTGEAFDGTAMVDARHGSSGGQVLLGVFPGLVMQKHGDLEVVSKALVRTM